MTSFILVHGTFARRSKFTLSGSQLRASIELACAAAQPGTHFEFYALRWTGRNRFLDRDAAAEQIAERVRGIAADHGPVFLIGHSHGGSAVAYFIKEYPELAHRIAGCAFLSTPFVAMRLRSYWADVADVMFFVATFFVALGLAKVASLNLSALIAWAHQTHFVVFGALAEVVRRSQAMPIVQWIVGCAPFFVTLIMTSWYVRRRYWAVSLRLLRMRLRKRIRKQQSVDLPIGNHLFLRATGDEAATILSAVQALAWIVHRIFLGISQWLGDLVRFVKILWTYWIGRIGLLFCAFDAFTALAYFNHGANFWRELVGVFSPNVTFGFEILFTKGATHNLLIFHELLVQPIMTFLLISGMMVLVIFLALAIISALASRAFGWSGLFGAIYVEFAVEPVPAGTSTIHHIPWREDEAGLMHSVTYDDPLALKELSRWVTEGARAFEVNQAAAIADR